MAARTPQRRGSLKEVECDPRNVAPSHKTHKMRRAHAGRVSMGTAHQKEAKVGVFGYQSLLGSHLVDTMVAVQNANTTKDNWFVELYGSRREGPSLHASAGRERTKFNGYVIRLAKPGPAFVLRESVHGARFVRR